jgi:hypothetical protein
MKKRLLKFSTAAIFLVAAGVLYYLIVSFTGFDKSGIMYQNLFDYMFAYSNYTASEGKIVSTYTTSDKKTTDKYTYSVDGDTLTLNNDTYSRISFSDLK